MPFATDRDLISLEPNLFGDVNWLSQRLVEATCAISGTTLSLTGADAAAVGVTTGHVALVAGAAVEVLERTSPTQLTVSRPRADPALPAIPPKPVTGASVVIATFAPQIGLVHAQLLRLAGIEPGAQRPGTPEESQVTNADALRLVESLGALQLIYSAAAALLGSQSPAAQRANLYAQRFAAERRRTLIALDLDADGQPDAVRRLNVARFVRG